MRLLALLATIAATAFTAAAIPTAADNAVFSALDAAGPAGQFTAVRHGGQVLLLPSPIGEVEVKATARGATPSASRAAAALGNIAASAVSAKAAALAHA